MGNGKLGAALSMMHSREWRIGRCLVRGERHGMGKLGAALYVVHNREWKFWALLCKWSIVWNGNNCLVGSYFCTVNAAHWSRYETLQQAEGCVNDQVSHDLDQVCNCPTSLLYIKYISQTVPIFFADLLTPVFIPGPVPSDAS